jgi:hypothetical protein
MKQLWGVASLLRLVAITVGHPVLLSMRSRIALLPSSINIS